jgi:DNA-binding CsgD family transcriptional regulator
MFTQDDAHGLSGTIGVLYAAQSRPEVVQAMMTAMNQRFQLVATTCEEFSSDTSFYMVHGLRTAVPAVPDHAAYIHDNPLVVPLSRAGATPVMQLRQQVSLAQWKGTDHYNGIARVSGIHDQLVIIARSAPSMVTVGLFRDAVFSGPERALNRLLQPHLAAAWQRVHQTEPSPAFTRSLRITLSPELRPLQLSVAAGQVFRDYFPRARNGGALPDTVQGWLLHALAELRSKPPTRPLRALTVESARGRLLLRCFPEPRDGLVHLVMMETPAMPDFFRLKAAGLTARECEVLHWIAQGKRDAEVAVVLDCAAATVSKHVEHILAKFRVETRSAAANTARDWLRDPAAT